jgi:flagellar assembly protein FliH
MHLSKVFRINEDDSLRKISFREFGPKGELIDDGLQLEQESFSETLPPVEAPSLPEDPPAPPRQSADPPDMGKKIEAAYLQGKEEGLQQANERFESSLEIFAQGIEEVSRLRETLLQNSTHDMLRLVMSIARQVIHCELSVNREVILATLGKALNAAVRSDSYQIKVNPEDLALVTEKKPFFLASINGLKNIVFEADPQIAQGGCLVESEFGEVDATIESQLEEIRRTLLDAMERN